MEGSRRPDGACVDAVVEEHYKTCPPISEGSGAAGTRFMPFLSTGKQGFCRLRISPLVLERMEDCRCYGNPPGCAARAINPRIASTTANGDSLGSREAAVQSNLGKGK
jgi:hypothetical protein